MSKPYWADHKLYGTNINVTYEARRFFRRVAKVADVKFDATTGLYLIPNFPKRGFSAEFLEMPTTGSYIYETIDPKTRKTTSQVHVYISRS